MKKLFAFLMFLSLLLPVAAKAGAPEQRCFSDNFGDLYMFSGGKLDKKPYMIRAHIGPCATTTAGVGTFAKLQDGTYFFSGIIGSNVAQTCVPFQIAAVFNSTVTSGTGNYDNFPQNSAPDGALTFTPISCASVPLTGPTVQQSVSEGNAPGKPTE